ncbi:MAG TPA: hypothetical protein VG603_04445 [Chitinophagales bacterium]|nr:hypothetical protein [Chitinophagales bacterium]
MKWSCLIALVIMFFISSCQKRTVCHIQTVNGGTSYARLYAGSYADAQSYQQAIASLKAEGYTCDDSDAIWNP